MERLYQYIWKHRLMCRQGAGNPRRGTDFLTTDGRGVKIIYQGRHNCDAGPDFLGARLRIDNCEWAGNVEIHVRASDWNRHNHSADPAYGNVILHAVGVNDTLIADGRGGFLPQAVITFPETFASLYSRMSEKIAAVDCEDSITEVAPMTITGWKETLAVERMQQKAQRILDMVVNLEGDWQRACFITLARAMGFSLNADPMEMLARSFPLSIAAKHSDNPTQLEALLLGQAGMLDQSVNIFDEEYQALCREYYFLARKYGLKPLRKDIWKFARTRPQNFPTRRISLLARVLEGGFSLLAELLDAGYDPDSLGELIGDESLSKSALQLLNINMTAPMLYAYGASHGDPELCERAFDIWYETAPENNVITRQWAGAGIGSNTAADTQALIQLKKEYCDRNRCLDCRIGHAMLRKEYEKRI